MLDLHSCCPRQKQGVVSRIVGDDTILYDPDSRQVHVLNKTSVLVWKLCTGDFNLDMMEQEFRSKFIANKGDDMRRDLEENIAAFYEKGLVVLAP
jgi:hypothetical protein